MKKLSILFIALALSMTFSGISMATDVVVNAAADTKVEKPVEKIVEKPVVKKHKRGMAHKHTKAVKKAKEEKSEVSAAAPTSK